MRPKFLQGTRRFIFYQILILVLFVAMTLLNEIVDVSHIIFGDPKTPTRVSEIVIELCVAAFVFALELGFIHRLRRDVRVLEGFIPICANCKKIRHFDNWRPLEQYLLEHSMAELTHGICPECMTRLYPDL